MKLTLNNALRSKRSRFNPLTSLTPELLSRYLEAFEAGHLRDAANVWEALEQRDDLLRTVIAKRKKAVARHGWTILPRNDVTKEQTAEARQHADALEFFYSHLDCEHAVDTAQKGGFKLLARQMMDAVGKKFAVHEIVWNADLTKRGFVTAKFRFVPLAFFENTTGKLRFLETESATEGRDLEPGRWLITAGDGLMMASSTAWMFKHLSLDDWLKCSQKNGTPGVHGITTADRDSAEWKLLEQNLAELLQGNPVVHSNTEDVQVLDLLPRGTMPFPQLVERIDRLLAALWRGADLSTLSRDRGYGASLQEKETCALEEDDAEMLTETLNRQVDEWVIRQVFGEDVTPLAHVKVLVSPRECTTADIQIDEFLIRHGAPISIRETMSRYGRALPKAGEPIFIRPSQHQGSDPESSQVPVMGAAMENAQWTTGPAVTFRERSPGDPPNPKGDRGQEMPLLQNAPGADGTNSLLTSAATLPNGSAFSVLQPDWLQLSPYGEFPHARGLQRVNHAAAERLVAQFHSFRGRVGRLFGGVPFYVGHPDLPNASELADRKAYGWVVQLEAREDGLYGEVKWSDAGLELLRNAHFKYLSPFWEAREVGTENGRPVFEPTALLSVGLTNQPNIPVKPLANEQSSPAAALPHPGVLPTTGALPELSVRLPNLRAGSLSENLGSRRGELVRLENYRDRIQEAVLRKVQLGLSYDQAWDAVKRQHPNWFE